MFKQFNNTIKAQFSKMCKSGSLFVSSVDPNLLWSTYMNAFGQDKRFRSPDSSEHNCNKDRHFIKNYGLIVAITADYKLMTMFDDVAAVAGTIYEPVAAALSTLLHSMPIADVLALANKDVLTYDSNGITLGYTSTRRIYSDKETYGVVTAGIPYTFNHFHVEDTALKQYVYRVDKKSRMDALDTTVDTSIATIQNKYRTNKELLEKGLIQLSLSTLLEIKDLYDQGTLLRPELHRRNLCAFIEVKNKYDALPSSTDKQLFFWYLAAQSSLISECRFVNSLIGKACLELEEGKDIEEVCNSYNVLADPKNYKKTTAPISSRQKQEAIKCLEENDLTDAFTSRRPATIADIDANFILHINRASKTIGLTTTAALFKDVQTLSDLKGNTNILTDVANVPLVSIENFISHMLPHSSKVEVLVESRHQDNLAALFTGNRSIFKWSTPFSVTYANNLAGASFIKQAVKSAGGKTEVPLRCSLMWNHEDTWDRCDLDLSCKENNGTTVYYNSIYRADRVSSFLSPYGGQLDLDRINTEKGVPAVENIVYNRLTEGASYDFVVTCFSYVKGASSFEVELEVEDQVYTYKLPAFKYDRHNIKVATVEYKNGCAKVIHNVSPDQTTNKTRELWGLTTNQFHPVNLFCLSPNYWDENGTGDKQYLFFIKDCVPTEPLRSFHSEGLCSLLQPHRRTLELLGESSKLNPSNQHLAGLGFSANQKTDFVVKVTKENNSRVVRVTL